MINVKYIDPTYSIWGVPPNAADIILCSNLSQSAVHGVMAGFTGFSVGLVWEELAYIPVEILIKAGKWKINPLGGKW